VCFRKTARQIRDQLVGRSDDVLVLVRRAAEPYQGDQLLGERILVLGHYFQNPKASSDELCVGIFLEDKINDLILDYPG